jgi:hypothetical protein
LELVRLLELRMLEDAFEDETAALLDVPELTASPLEDTLEEPADPFDEVEELL